MKKNWVNILLVLVAMGLGVAAWFLLPDAVAVQVGLDGHATNTLPKALAVGIPLGISVVGSAMNLTAKEVKNAKGYTLAVVGIGVLVLTMLLNR